MQRRGFLILLIVGTAVGCGRTPSGVADSVRVWEDEVVYPTYPLGPEDPNPRFFELEGSAVYPYTMQENLTSTKAERTYRAWFLENEYIRLMCLPEIGGRIQFVYDKRRQPEEPVFYHNRVLRPGLIALRGAWVSGGIEWNRGPMSHTVTSFSPVDVIGGTNADGSASLLIGGTEKNFRTFWQVRLTLRPGRTYLEEEIVLSNPTDGFHPYYFWNNTAFPNREKTRFIFPMALGTDHEGTSFFRWPNHEGRDLTKLTSYEAPTSIFAVRSVFDFFGAYDGERDFGVVQVANHRELPGKKAWTWGQADSGLVAQSVLTDDDGPYIEVQSGPLPTQSDYGMLAPGQEIRWRELWYPVFDLGDGFEYATEELAVERIESATEDRLELRFHPTGTFPDAEIELRVVSSEADTVTRTATLSPEETLVIELDVAPSSTVDVSVRSADGLTLVSYRSPLEVPIEEPPVIEERPARPMTADEIYQLARKLDRDMDRVRALEQYDRTLELSGTHVEALVGKGSLLFDAGRYDEAKELFLRASRLDTEHGMARFLLGSSAFALGDLETALDLGYEASKREGTRALGLGLAGRALLRLERFSAALDVLDRAYIASGRSPYRELDDLLLALLASGAVEEAGTLAASEVDNGTIRLVPLAIHALASGEELGVFAERSRAIVGEDEFAFLELALSFARVGLFEDALGLLSATAIDSVPATERSPLPLYYAAFWSHELGRERGDDSEAERYLQQATALSHDYVFPSRPEAIPVLRFAKTRIDDPRVSLLLGNLYAGLGRTDEAETEWREAVATESRDQALSVAHRNIALVEWKLRGDRDAAAASFARAIEARPRDGVLYRDLARLRLEQGRPAGAIEALESLPDDAIGRERADLVVLLARAYVETERFTDAIELLESVTFSNREGDAGTWSTFARAHLERGWRHLDAGRAADALTDFDAAQTYPENLNVGRPAEPHEARALYYRGLALEALGRRADARESFQQCTENAPSTAEQVEFRGLCRIELAR